MRPLLLAVLCVTACGPNYYLGEIPTFVTKHGVIVDDSVGFLQKADLDLAEDVMIDMLPRISMTWAVQDPAKAIITCLERLTVSTKPGPWDCSGNGTCAGVTYGYGDTPQIIVADMQPWTHCEVQNPYAHELGHYLQGCLNNGDEDPHHNNHTVWDVVMVASNRLYCQ